MELNVVWVENKLMSTFSPWFYLTKIHSKTNRIEITEVLLNYFLWEHAKDIGCGGVQNSFS